MTSQLCASKRVHTNTHTQAVIKHCRNESLYWSFKLHMAQGEGSPNNLNYWSALGRRLSAGVFAALSVDGRHIRMSDLVGSLALDENDNGYSDTYTHIRPSSIPGAIIAADTKESESCCAVLPLKLHGWREKNRDGKARSRILERVRDAERK